MQPPATANRSGSPDPQGDLPVDPTPRRDLALLGASVRAPAQSAQRAGCRVVALDRFGDRDTLLACSRHLLLPAADRMGNASDQDLRAQDCDAGDSAEEGDLAEEIGRIVGQMPLIPVGGLHGWPRWLSALPLLAAWPGQREAAERARQLPTLQASCQGTRFQLPPTLSSPEHRGLEATRAETIRWLCKSVDSSGGLGTRWRGSSAADQPEPSGSGDWVQQWVPGRLFGANFLSNGRAAVLLGVCRSLFTRKGSLPFVYCGSLGPIDVGEDLRCELEAWARRVVVSTQLRGLFNLDYLMEPSGRIWLLEINPRWSGSSELIERNLRRRQADVSLAGWMLDGLDGLPLPQSAVAGSLGSDFEPSVYLKRIVFARRDHWFDASRIESLLGERETLHDLPVETRLVHRGEPICTLITQLTGKEQDPMRRHRVLVDQISGIRDR